MNSKRDIFFEGKIYQDANFGYVPGNSQYAKDYLSTLTNYPVQGNHSFKDGQEVVEGKDYEKQHQIFEFNGWKTTTEINYNRMYNRRIVALPLPASTGEGVKEKAVELYNKFEKIFIDANADSWGNEAKQCAIILCDEIIDGCTWKEATYKKNGYIHVDPKTTTEFWQQVRQHITTL